MNRICNYNNKYELKLKEENVLMEIVINGSNEIVEQNRITITELLVLKEVRMPDMVSVQLNGVFVKTDDFVTTVVSEKDEIDFLYFMGGGR